MSLDTPEEGDTSEQGMYWGDYLKDITGLTNYNVVNCYSDTTQDSNTLTTDGYAYLPSDKFTGMPSKVCPSIKYYLDSSTTTTKKPSPSPYKVVDGEWLPNEDYYTIRISNANALSDFDGPKNTKIITDNVTVENWKSVKPIANKYSDGHYPAACCCARFKTIGTNSFVDMLNRKTADDTEEYWKQNKVWYMPACGELGYILPNFSVNNVALNNISNLYGSGVAVQLDSNSGYYYGYWSSSERGQTEIWYIDTTYGSVDNEEMSVKDNISYVRAFCALPA